jgi:hypothetical protein
VTAVTVAQSAVAVAAVAATAVLLAGRTSAGADAGSVTADIRTAPVRAGDSASIDVGRIVVITALSPGSRYRLPTFGVRNPGGRPARILLGIASVAGEARKPAPATWFRFAPKSFALSPGRARPVSTRLEVPEDAEPGEYAALLGAWGVPEPDGGRAGAAGGASVTFSVESSGALDAWTRRVGWGWIWLALASMLVLWRRHRHM